MSRTPYFFVERYSSKREKYELQHPLVWNWEHTKRVPADLFPYNGCHDLFSIIENSGGLPAMRGIHNGIPNDTSEEIKKAFDECCYEVEYDGENHLYTPGAVWFTYADMYIYCMENPEVIDYEAMDEAFYDGNTDPPKIMKPTPMCGLKDRVDAFMEVMDGWDWRDDYSLIRIVCWIE